MKAKVWVCDKLWRGPFPGLDAVVGLNMTIDFGEVLANCGVLLRGGCHRCVPSRTLKPILFQSMVFTGGGGNVMLKLHR